jgi:diamine N-acetyltransferase
MKHNYVATLENVTLRPLNGNDIEKLRIWRNNPENTKFLRNIGIITPEQQQEWFKNYLMNETEMIFAIVETDIVKDVVGSVSLYDIRDGMAEIGRILIGDARAHGRGVGRKAFVMVMALGFSNMGINRIVASVSPDNVQAYTNYMRNGFKITGEHTLENGIMEKEIAITYDELVAANKYVNDIKWSMIC